MSGHVLQCRAKHVFLPMRRVIEGPPYPWRSWKQPGAMAAWLRGCGFELEEVVNWIRARCIPGCPLRMPYAPEHGYWLFYYGADPTPAALRKATVH